MVWNKKRYKWYYDKIHSRYYNLLIKFCFGGREKKVREDLLASINFLTNERILDMCCGTGGATFPIAEKAGQESKIIGIDLSSGQIKIARKINRFENVRFIEGNATQTGFEEGYFDKVFIPHALHEMYREERLSVLREAKRVLKEGGKLVIFELDRPENFFVRLFIGFWFFYWLPFNFETPTRRDMLKRGLTNEVKEAGFRNIRKISKYRGVIQIVEGEK